MSETLHVDADRGLWLPPELRDFEKQIVFRTPRATLQHFGSGPLDPYSVPHKASSASCFCGLSSVSKRLY